jgi:phosphate ABC transporter phosphate-binding protein
MAAPVSTTDLRALVERSGLLAPELLDRAFADAANAETAIRWLTGERLLTPFQAEQLQKGRADGFFITDKYKILDYIGAGGMGTVYLCEHLILHRLVAVKMLHMPGASGPEAARAFERFYREARAVAALSDPNIIRVFDVDRAGPNPFMVMEYADGTNLHDIVSRHGPLAANRAAEYVRQAALGLQHAHEIGLVHRDIKPGNLLVDRTGTVKLLDLGLARFNQDPTRNQGITEKYDRHMVLGTVDFMAPEQAFETSAVDIRSDIYGLGCSFYYMLTGQVPFPDRTATEKMIAHRLRAPAPVSEICPRVPPGILAVLERMMAKEPADRYQTPAEVVTALAACIKGPVAAPPANEMPEHAAEFYRLGLSPAPGTAPGSAITPNPFLDQDTARTPGLLPPFPAPTPRRGTAAPSTGEEQVPGSARASVVTRARMTARRRRRLVRLAELVLFVLAAGAVGWLASREWMHAGRPVAPATAEPGPEAKAPPPGTPNTEATRPFAGPVLNAGGSTFASPLMRHWAETYEKTHGIRLDYQSVGSGPGAQGLISRVYDFACSNVPLTDRQLADAQARGGDIVHVPLAIGAVAVAYNLPGLPEPLQLTGPALADIYLGKITKWKDAAISICNPGVKLPDLAITVVRRSDSSGTSYVWSDYLTKVSADWSQKVGRTTELNMPGGTAANGENGVAAAISRRSGAIGYVELSHALENNLAVARVKNRAGKFIAPGPDGVSAAAAALRPIPADLRFSLTDSPAESAYPIAGTAWAILYANQVNRPGGHKLLAFLRWVTHEGQASAADLKFAPLPAEMAKQIEERLASVRLE